MIWIFLIIITTAALLMLIMLLVSAPRIIKSGGRFGSNCMRLVPPDRPSQSIEIKCPPGAVSDVLNVLKNQVYANDADHKADN